MRTLREELKCDYVLPKVYTGSTHVLPVTYVIPQLVELLVRPEGLEPPTPRSVVWCSIH
jgi:hypothetical protein